MVGLEQSVSGLVLWRWRRDAIASAQAAHVSALEVDWLLQEVASLDRLALRLESFKDWSQIELKLPLAQLEQLWQRRLYERLPVQYITGVTPWRRFKIAVTPAVLIPRPETECLADIAALAVSQSHINPPLEMGHWVDLGTGSGAIALSLADAFPHATIHAIDFSPQALAIAQHNAQTAGFDHRINFYQGSWWEPLAAFKGQISGMVSNPPYIPSSTILTLEPEVAKHEPHLALDGGEDGLDCIRYLIESAPAYLRPGGIWLIEMMAGQASLVTDLLAKQGSYCNIKIYPDLAGIKRFAFAQLK